MRRKIEGSTLSIEAQQESWKARLKACALCETRWLRRRSVRNRDG